MFDRETGRGVTLEAWRESSKPRAVLRTRRVYTGGKRRRGDVGVDSLDFTKKILHMAWHPSENIIAIAATNNLYIFQDRVNPETQGLWWTHRGTADAVLSHNDPCLYLNGLRKQTGFEHKRQSVSTHVLGSSTCLRWQMKWQRLLTYLMSEEEDAFFFCSTLTGVDISSTQMMFRATNSTFWRKEVQGHLFNHSVLLTSHCCTPHWNTPF